MKLHSASVLLSLWLSLVLVLTPSADAASVTSYVGSVVAVSVSILAGLVIKYNKLAPIYTPEPYSMSDKTIVITGANTGLGLESAKRLAAAGAKVVLTVRSHAKGEATVRAVQDHVRDETGSNDDAPVSYKVLNLDSIAAIKESVATSWDDVLTIDVLMNNAGAIGGSVPKFTDDGMELSFQTNHLGPFLLTGLLQDKLSHSARIIIVSSEAYRMAGRKLDFDYVWNPTQQQYGFFYSYAQSKLANILFAQELQRRVDSTADRDWTIVSCHPGAVATELGRVEHEPLWKQLLGRAVVILLRSPAQGAATQVWLAAGAHGDDLKVRGAYLADQSVQTLPNYAKDKVAAARLWKESEERSGFVFDLAKRSEQVVEARDANADVLEEDDPVLAEGSGQEFDEPSEEGTLVEEE